MIRGRSAATNCNVIENTVGRQRFTQLEGIPCLADFAASRSETECFSDLFDVNNGA